MRQLRPFERGSANWPFIIALILLLAFVYLWWDEKDQREVAVKKAEETTADAEAQKEAAAAFAQRLDKFSEKVGYRVEEAAKLFTAPDAAEYADDPEGLAQAVLNYDVGTAIAASIGRLTDLDQLGKHLSTDGEDADGNPGLLNFLLSGARVDILKEIRKEGEGAGEEKATSFEWMTPDFKAKLEAASRIEIPQKPNEPEDPDDQAAMATYNEQLLAYEAAVKNLNDAINELQQMDGWKKWEGVIKPPKRLAPGQREIVSLAFFAQTPTGQVTVEKLLRYPPQAIKALINELRINKESDAGIIDDLRGQITAKDDEINSLQENLRGEQERHVSDMESLNGELQTANDTAEAARQQATTALQQVESLKDEKQQEVTTRDAQISALNERIRLDKEKRALKIRRDADDGMVLSASPTMRTAIVDLGTQDKVYPGLKFKVSYTGKGGHRMPKGMIMITHVLGRTSSKAKIVEEMNPGNPIGQGDIIHNPYFNATDPIHIWLAGELERYPIEVARPRLAKMGVTIDAEINSDTDYVVIPDSMSAPAPAASGDEDEGDDEEGAVVGQSEFEQIKNLARTFGANVITERMLSEFLGF